MEGEITKDCLLLASRLLTRHSGSRKTSSVDPRGMRGPQAYSSCRSWKVPRIPGCRDMATGSQCPLPTMSIQATSQ